MASYTSYRRRDDEVLAVLAKGEASCAEIAAQLRMVTPDVNAHMRRLAALGLVEKRGLRPSATAPSRIWALKEQANAAQG